MVHKKIPVIPPLGLMPEVFDRVVADGYMKYHGKRMPYIIARNIEGEVKVPLKKV